MAIWILSLDISLTIGEFFRSPAELLEIDVNVYLLAAFIMFSTGYSACYFLILQSIRLKWEKPPALIHYGWLTLFIVALIMCVSCINLDLFTIFSLPLQLIGDVLRSGAGIFLLYSYLTPDLVLSYEPLKWTIRRWQVIGFMIATVGIINIGWTFLAIVNQVLLETLLTTYIGPLTMYNIAMNVLIVYTTFRNPEALLISHAQVVRACKIYARVHVFDEELYTGHWGLSRIKEYIRQVPEAVFEEYCE